MLALNITFLTSIDEPNKVLVEALLLVLAVVPVFYGAALVHEFGHFLAGRLVGLPVTSFGLGTARPFFAASLGETRFYLARSRPFQGITFFFLEPIYPSRAQYLLILSGGILA